MGVQQNPSQPRNRIKFKLGPYNLLVIVACGAALTAAELKAKAAATMDSLAHNTGIGEASGTHWQTYLLGEKNCYLGQGTARVAPSNF